MSTNLLDDNEKKRVASLPSDEAAATILAFTESHDDYYHEEPTADRFTDCVQYIVEDLAAYLTLEESCSLLRSLADQAPGQWLKDYLKHQSQFIILATKHAVT